MLREIKQIFSHKTVLDRDAFKAYYDRLPEKIDIKWFRDGNFIIGDIKTEDHHFKTQGVSGDDFIEMVNDSLYTVYDIPQDYLKALSKVKSYEPDALSLERLNNSGIKQSEIRLEKQQVKLA